MKRTFLLLFFVCLAFGCNAQNLDSMYTCLDKAIANSSEYMRNKQFRIDELKNQYRYANNGIGKYNIGLKLYEEYHALMNDSAISYLNRCIQISENLHRKDLKVRAYILIAHQFAVAGFYAEAQYYYSLIDKNKIKGSNIVDYYYGLCHLYGDMAFYAKDNKMKQLYFKTSDNYLSQLYKFLDSNTTMYLYQKSVQLCNEGKYKESLMYNDRWMKKVKPGTHDNAIAAFFRSEIYKNMKDVKMQKYWLCVSALYDIKCSVMDQSSLWSLADLVNRDGDVERSYRYIEYSWSCISTFSTHMRGWLVSPILTMISNKYKEKLKTANHSLSTMIVVVSVLSFVLLVLLVSVFRKETQLKIARNDLSDTNNELESLNGKLNESNAELSLVNRRLNESNIVKDEYIGKFLSICSEYIDKLDNYRIKVRRMAKCNQFKEILSMTSSQTLKDSELKELFDNFDSVFLHLFPNFIDDFNFLLKEECRIKLSDRSKLTTDLRIFALIRLGIDESSRIAEFLRYSPNSIYNYRARIKKNAICGRDDFEKKVKEIGMEMGSPD
jgi:hypothetical protein